MQPSRILDHQLYYSEIKFEQPVKLLTVSVVYGLKDATRQFYDDAIPIYERVLPDAYTDTPAFFGSSGEKVNKITFNGAVMQIYSYL